MPFAPFRFHLAACTLLAAMLCTACRGDAPTDAIQPGLVDRTVLSMGTSLTLTAWTGDSGAANQAFDAAAGEFDRLDAILSVWKPGSDVLKANAAAGEHAVAVSP